MILVAAPGGVKVPPRRAGSVEEIVGPRQITRENNQRFITIQCNVGGRDIGSFVAEAQAAIDDEVELPAGYLRDLGRPVRAAAGGQPSGSRWWCPSRCCWSSCCCSRASDRCRNALLILFNIPLALVGGVVALWLTGQNLSVPASVGFIALFGIALENGMVLVTYLNQLVRAGVTAIDDASVRGACLRLRPVLMTAVTTALGLMPLLLSTGTGSEVQRPLATGRHRRPDHLDRADPAGDSGALPVVRAASAAETTNGTGILSRAETAGGWAGTSRRRNSRRVRTDRGAAGRYRRSRLGGSPRP